MGSGQVRGLLLADTAVHRRPVEPAAQYSTLSDQLDLFRREFTRRLSNNAPEGQGCLRRREPETARRTTTKPDDADAPPETLWAYAAN